VPLNTWEWILLISTAVVIVGVILESSEAVHAIRQRKWKPILPLLGFGLLVIGLAVELLAEAKIQTTDAALKRQADVVIADLQRQAAQSNADAANARLEEERLKTRVTWRSLRREQCERLASSLPSSGTVRIEYPSGDPEALLLAINFENCFHDIAHWTVLSAAMLFQDALPFGLNVTGDQRKLSEAVKSGLRNAGVEFSSNDSSELERHVQFRVAAPGSEDVKIIVGSKPIL
jgi:hypothetical protein